MLLLHPQYNNVASIQDVISLASSLDRYYTWSSLYKYVYVINTWQRATLFVACPGSVTVVFWYIHVHVTPWHRHIQLHIEMCCWILAILLDCGCNSNICALLHTCNTKLSSLPSLSQAYTTLHVFQKLCNSNIQCHSTMRNLFQKQTSKKGF